MARRGAILSSFLLLIPTFQAVLGQPGGGQCPAGGAKPNLDVKRFMGMWYILEYQYASTMEMSELSCLAFQFQEAEYGIVGNFSFRFPPRFGHYYHIPTLSNVVAPGQDSLWMTTFKGVELLTAVMDTDYANWAVFLQCSQDNGDSRFMSTRVMSRDPILAPEHWLAVREVIQNANVQAEYKYEVNQQDCQGRP